MVYCLLSNMKRKMMVAEAFVLFFPVTPELNGGSYAIAVLVDRHSERILVIFFLAVLILFLEVLIQFPYSLLFL